MLKPPPTSYKLNLMMRVWSAKTQNMGVKLVVYTAASHVSEVNLDMFFTSALNTTDGGGCIETEFVFHDFTFFC